MGRKGVLGMVWARRKQQVTGHCCCKKTIRRLFALARARAWARRLALIGLIENKP
jgi:hypothetical protein